MDRKYIVRGATVQCSEGSNPSQLNMPVNHGFYVNEKPVLNDQDCIAQKNVMPFGNCKCKRGPCSPALAQAWENTEQTALINDRPAVVSTSTLSCAIGGFITIVSDGQKG